MDGQEVGINTSKRPETTLMSSAPSQMRHTSVVARHIGLSRFSMSQGDR